METRTRFALLTHPKEYRRQKTGTGRMASLHLASCEILPGLAFDEDARVRELVAAPGSFAALLYPGPAAIDLGDEEAGRAFATLLGARRLVVFLVDSTWSCAGSVLRSSPGIAALPRLGIRPREPSRWVIKRQPRSECLSTIEAIHELLCALDGLGLECYPDRDRLLRAFVAMQAYQLARTARGN
jgi:DTW domain-containing protein YfiP